MNCHFRLQAYLNCDCNFLILQRKRDSLELDRESTAEEGEVVLWRANFEEFLRRLRHMVGFLSSLSLSLSLMLNCLMFCILQCHVLPVLFISSDESNLFLFLSILNIFFCFCFFVFFLCEMKCFKLKFTIFILALIS